MINFLVTADFMNMKKLGAYLLNSGLGVDGAIQNTLKDNGLTEYVIKFSCPMEKMLSMLHLCGKEGIDLNIRSLNLPDITAEAVCCKI